MPGNLQPLAQNFKIVDEYGNPTPYFIQWAQQRQIDITAGITAAEAQQLIDDWAAARDVIAGVGLTGGGPLSSDVTLNVGAGTGIGIGANDVHLLDTAVVPGTYGDATHVGQFTVDQQGRITAAANIAISGGGGGGTTPTFVQVKSAIGGTSAVTLGAAPTAGNMLFAIATHWNTLSATAYVNAGWTPLDLNNGAVTDGYMLAMKYALPGESATQTPFVAASSMSTTIFEVSGALVAIPVVRGIKSEITVSPMTVPCVSPKTGSLLIGISAQGGSNAAFTPVCTAAPLTIDENITAATASNTPRRTQSFHASGIAFATNTSVVTTFTPGNMVGVVVMIVGS